MLAGGAFTASQIAPVSIYVLGACARCMPFHSLPLALPLPFTPRYALHSVPILLSLSPSTAGARHEVGSETARERRRAKPSGRERVGREGRGKRRRDGERTEPARSRERTREARGRKSERAGAFAWGAIAARHSKPANGRASSHGTGSAIERTHAISATEERGRYIYIFKKKKGGE